MRLGKQKKILDNVIEGPDGRMNLKDASPQVLTEILYEYLSQNISTHFEETVEGIDTLHNSLLTRQKEHKEILEKLEKLEDRLVRIEKTLEAAINVSSND